MEITIVFALIFGGYLYYQSVITQKRREYIFNKYPDTEVAQKILDKIIWQGETANQLLDSLGKPEACSEKVLKTKRKESWKYNHRHGRVYDLVVQLENGIVVGWDSK